MAEGLRQYERLVRLIGPDQLARLRDSRVLIAGVGGVGSYVCEALARSGIGHLVLVDNDAVDVTNLNRQIEALHSTVGLRKAEVLRQRVLDIDPGTEVTVHDTMVTAAGLDALFDQPVDYVVDAIDTITCKLDLIDYAQRHGIPVISSLGMANRRDPTQVVITRLDKTTDDPLAKAMRSQARRRGIDLKVKVVFSREKPLIASELTDPQGLTSKQRHQLGSTVFVPAAAGLALAYAVFEDLTRTAS